MKKKITIILSAVVLMCLILIVSACSANESVYREIYYAHYGEWFVLPVCDSASVTAGDGSAVSNEAGRIFIDRTDDYSLTIESGGKTKKSRITVVNNRRPLIMAETEMMYGVAGEPVALCAASASDGVKEIETRGKMFYGEKEIDVVKGFVPQEKGIYNYVLTATGNNGLTAVKEIPYYIEAAESDYADKISSFDKPYGVNQTGFTYARSAYSDEVGFEEEAGSLQLQLNPSLSANSYEFILTNLNEADITKFDAFYFYAYNESNVNIELYINWAKSYSLKPHAWTRVELARSEYESVLLASTYPSIKDNFKLTDINGLNLNLNFAVSDLVLREDCVYFSAIRGLHKKDSTTVKNEIENIIKNGKVSVKETDNINYHYSQLSVQGKAVVSNYVNFQNLIISQEMQKQGISAEKDKILYFDEKAGESQIAADFGVSTYTVTDEKTYLGKNTLKIVANGLWDLGLKFIRPYIYDIRTYDTLSFAIYNGADDDLLLYNSDSTVKNIGSGGDFILKAKAWTRLVIPTGNAEHLICSLLWLRQISWDHPTGIASDTVFYISSVYGAQLADILGGFTVSDYEDDSCVEGIISAYTSLSESEKAELQTAYDRFMKGYIEYLGQSGNLGENTVLSFDSEIGMKQIKDMYDRADISYTTAVKYGGETGSTKLTSRVGADLDLSVIVPAKSDFAGTETLEFYVYYEGIGNYSLYVDPTASWKTDNGTALVSGAWTKVSIPLNGRTTIQGYMLMIMNDSWTFDVGETVYFSALKVAE